MVLSGQLLVASDKAEGHEGQELDDGHAQILSGSPTALSSPGSPGVALLPMASQVFSVRECVS